MSGENQEITSKLDSLKESVDILQRTLLQLDAKLENFEHKIEETQTGIFLWKIPNFSLEKQKRSKLTSENFYTNPFGYKIRMELYPNGNGEGKDTHVSVYYRIVSGKYDELVNWPFRKAISVTLLDLNEDTQSKSNVETTFYHDPHYSKKLAFEKPRDGGVDLLNWGTDSFVSHQLLNESTYLKNDTIYILVKVI